MEDDIFPKKERTTSMIKRSEHKLRSILDASPFPIIVSTLKDHRVMYMNKDAAKLFGYQQETAHGQPEPDIFVNPADRDTVMDILEKVGEVDDYDAELKTAERKVFPALVSAKPMDFEGFPSVFLSFNDITRRKQLETKLIRLATTDALTGISNRKNFFDIGEREVKIAARYEKPISVLMIDIDYFKQFNDKYGHDLGDQVLKKLGGVLVDTLRETDIFGRIGGEEFAAVLPETDLVGAKDVAERLRNNVETHKLEHDGESLTITISVGVTQFKPGDATLPTTLKRADVAL
ncbi:MAG: sensor domain-containing diguanylate cyclase, partial [Planctomycetota bacterium]